MSDAEERESGEIPEGMVLKTRKVRKKRKGKKSAEQSREHADTLFAKAKDLFVGMEEEDHDAGHVDLAEQVRRLQKRQKDERPLDEMWGTKRRSVTWLWIVLIGLIVTVVAIIVGVTKWVSDDPRNQVNTTYIGSTVGQLNVADLGEGPLGWFNDKSIQVLDEVKGIIRQANVAEDPESFSKFVRDSPNRSLEELKPELWGADFLTNASSKFTWTPKIVNASEGAGEKKRGYLKIAGTRVDGNPYEAYFVEVNKRVTLDWDATIAWSEMSVLEIAQKKPRREIYLRCRVSKKTTYDQKFGKSNYSGYVLSGEISDEYFHAYVPLDKEEGRVIDRDLRLLLNYGSFVTDRPPFQNQKATVRVRFDNGVGREGIFEIVEFLHDGWVRP